MDEDLLDEYGYPTEAALDLITKWNWEDEKGYFEFIKSIWWMPGWGWSEGVEPKEYYENVNVYRYYISTGGWSGNEDIIRAMQNNILMWAVTWVQSKRGGHYIFELREYKDEVSQKTS